VFADDGGVEAAGVSGDWTSGVGIGSTGISSAESHPTKTTVAVTSAATRVLAVVFIILWEEIIGIGRCGVHDNAVNGVGSFFMRQEIIPS
jgi:hypothetical protein